MADAENPFSDLDIQQAIDLRWTLRDIKAKRWRLSPINPSHLEKLVRWASSKSETTSPILRIPDWMQFPDTLPNAAYCAAWTGLTISGTKQPCIGNLPSRPMIPLSGTNCLSWRPYVKKSPIT
jgi:hypothetical protein